MLEHITCQCPILGLWQSGLIVLHDGKLGTVGESQVHHNLHPTNARLIEGEPLEVVSYKVDMRRRSLAWLLERIDKQRTYGELLVGKELKEVADINLYYPANFYGKVLHLHYARKKKLYAISKHGRSPGGGVCAILAEAGGAAGGSIYRGG
jgi:inner membrane protein